MPPAPKKVRRIEYDFYPAAVGSDETKAICQVMKGERVTRAQALVLTAAAASTQSTIALGDGAGVAGFIAAYDTETQAAGTLLDGGGTYFANAGGKLYTADDTIDVTYDQTTPGATNPGCRFSITIEKT